MESKKDLDLLVENFFKPKKKKTLLNLGALLEMVEQAMNEDAAPAQSAMSAKIKDMSKSFLDMLPKFEISEAWGQKDTDARQQFEAYMNNIPGPSIEAKLRYLNLFTERVRPEKYETYEILSNLMFLDLLSTVVNNFSPSGAGFLFEAFLAGLLRGTQQVIKADGELQIDDLRDAEGKPISLKLLVPTTPVKGSIKNLIGFLSGPDGREGIEYLCVYKFGKDETKGISFYSFIIDSNNIYYWLADELGFQIELNEAADPRLTHKQDITGSKAEKTLKKQAAAREFVKAALAFKKRVGPKMLSMLLSADAKKGVRMIKKAAQDFGYRAPAEFDLTDQQMNEMPPDELGATAARRRKFFKSMDFPTDHELGDFRGESEAEVSDTATKDIGYFRELYADDPREWARQLAARGGIKMPPPPVNAVSENSLTESKVSQFEINSNDVLKKALPPMYRKKRLGYLQIDRDNALRLAEEYTDSLKNTVVSIFSALDALTQGITGYYLTPQGDNRFTYGQTAVLASEELNDLITDPEKGVQK